ncbi:MAG: site-2 protease family protein [Actinomycetota bacterium]|nr:site-2 protease family protein [Actinomycetota bacterium]
MAAVVIVAVALAVILLRSHHLSAVSVMIFCVLIPSIILHEVSHGLMAYACGDDTARRAGRLTLNPLAHVDVVGTIIVPIVLVLSGVGAFGWAKPVPVNVSKLRHPRNQAVLVSLVGPAVNIVLALLAAFVYRDLVPYHDKVGVLFTGNITDEPGWAQVVFLTGYVNVILAAFNLIPLPPLDGSAVVERLIPSRWLPGYYRIRPFTLILPLALVLISSFGGANGDILNRIFDPALSWWARVVGL